MLYFRGLWLSDPPFSFFLYLFILSSGNQFFIFLEFWKDYSFLDFGILRYFGSLEFWVLDIYIRFYVTLYISCKITGKKRKLDRKTL